MKVEDLLCQVLRATSGLLITQGLSCAWQLRPINDISELISCKLRVIKFFF